MVCNMFQGSITVMSSAQAQVMVPLWALCGQQCQPHQWLLWSSARFPSIPAGSYMGEGLLPILEHLTKKILQLEFVKMCELMPET